jgi:predicted transcriptional regulator
MAVRAPLSRRERQILDVLFQRGRATAAEVQQGLADAPGYSAVRALLRILEQKGHVAHSEESGRYVYTPTMAPDAAKRSALKHLVDTFFEGSLEKMVVSLVDGSAARLSPRQLEKLAKLIETAKRKEGR